MSTENKSTNQDSGAAEDSAAAEKQPDVSMAEFSSFDDSGEAEPVNRNMDLLLDVWLPVSIELGRARMFIKEILELERGSIIELDKMAGEAVDLFVNNKKVAEGEVVVVDKHFGVRITHLIDPADRIKSLNGNGRPPVN